MLPAKQNVVRVDIIKKCFICGSLSPDSSAGLGSFCLHFAVFVVCRMYCGGSGFLIQFVVPYNWAYRFISFRLRQLCGLICDILSNYLLMSPRSSEARGPPC